MLLLQTGQKTLSPPAASNVAPKGESLSDNEPCEDHRERETQHDLKIKVIQMATMQNWCFGQFYH